MNKNWPRITNGSNKEELFQGNNNEVLRTDN